MQIDNSYDFDYENIWSFDNSIQRPKLKYMKDLSIAAQKGDVKVYPEKDFYYVGDKVILQAVPWPGHKFDGFIIRKALPRR